ncbi:MAG: hypothetical protein OWU32_12740 [Firmicutes bacterium]|nr:hypothetical protein [Bacillota bacterium]
MIGKKTLGGLALVVLSTALAVPAMAATQQDGFVAHYQNNAALETSLLQKAEAGGTSAPGTAVLSAVVQSINAQVATLYQSEATLSGEMSTVQSVYSPSQVQDKNGTIALVRERNGLLLNLQGVVKSMNRAGKDHKKWNEDRKHEQKILARLQMIEKEIRQKDARDHHSGDAKWRTHPYDNGFAALKVSIFELQEAAIHYTREWIALNGTASATASTTSSTGTGTGN